MRVVEERRAGWSRDNGAADRGRESREEERPACRRWGRGRGYAGEHLHASQREDPLAS
jgi:hypothetical protein